MAVDPWAIDSSAGAPSYGGADLRLGLLLPLLAGNAGSSGLAVRSGVRLSGTGLDLLVAAQASPNMSIKTNVGAAVMQGSISATQGPYGWALDTATTSTIAASHATLDRTDVAAVRIRDANIDTSGGRDASIVVITGTNGGGVPSLPTDATYMTIAQVFVQHAVTSIVNGAITDKRTFYSTIGGQIPMVSTARATGTFPGDTAVEMDTGYTYRWRSSTTKWIREPLPLGLTSGFSATTATFADVAGLAFTGDVSSTYYFEGWFSTVAATAGDLGVQWVLPTGASIEWGVLSPSSGNAGTNLDSTIYQGTITTVSGQSIGGMASVGTAARLAGVITTDATHPGTCKVQANNPGASGTSFIRQAYLNVMQVA